MRPLCYLLFVLFLLPETLLAQTERGATLVGSVRETGTDAPLAGVHVFIASSMQGTVTDERGRFRLADVPLGAHTLYVSILGFEKASEEIYLTAPGEQTFTFRLQPDVLELGGVTVEGERDRRWPRRLRKFERLFLGEANNAEETEILNPEVLSFEGGWGRLVAHAAEPLVIENRALGYRIRYFLEEFTSSGGTLRYDGEPLFEELTPEGPEEAARWAENRKRAYYGSFRHFLLALLDAACREEGFLTYIRPTGGALGLGRERYRLPPDRLLSEEREDSLWTLDFPGHVEIVYLHEREEERYVRRYRRSGWRTPEPQTSYIELTDGPTQVDHTGEVLDPYGVTVSGYFAYEGVANELPKEYRPGKSAVRSP